jgi:hypothetical protein
VDGVTGRLAVQAGAWARIEVVGLQAQRVAVRHCFVGVGGEVGQDLAELTRVDVDSPQGRIEPRRQADARPE